MKNTSDSLININLGITADARLLIWNIFFESRNRGVSLEAHFPWINNLADLYCISVDQYRSEKMPSTIACLVLKVVHGLQNKHHNKIGLIGLVCVAEAYRGRGLSTLLLTESIKLASHINLDGLVLWTQKPGVYTKHSFTIDKEDTFKIIEKSASNQPSSVKYITQSWSDLTSADNTIGLPPFAISGIKIVSAAASAIILETQTIPTVTGWNGLPADVADLLVAAIPQRWGMNLNEQDNLNTELVKRDCAIQIAGNTFRMVRKLTDSAYIPDIKFLQRI